MIRSRVSCVTGVRPWVPRVPGPPAPPPGSRSRVPGGLRRRLGWGLAPRSVRRLFRSTRSFVGDCIAALERAAARQRRPGLRRPALQSPARTGAARAPTSRLVDAVDDDWDKFASFADYDAFTRAWLARLPPRAEAERDALGDRLLPQHLPRRRDAAGSRLLDPQRHRLAQGQPDAELPRPRFTNAHETLIWAAQGRRRQGLHLQLRGAEGRQRRRPDALRLALPALHRRRAPEGRATAARSTRPRSPKRCSRACCSRRRKPGDVVLDPFFGTGTTGAVAKRLGRHFIGIEREPRLCRRRRARRIAAVEPLADEAIAPAPAKRAEPRVPFLSVVEGGLVQRRARRSSTSAAATRRMVRADGTLALGPVDRLDPQDRRARPGPAGLQRLDLLARRAQRRPRHDRRLPGNRARRDGHRLIWRAAARRNVSPGRELPLQDSSEGRRQ